MISWSEPPADEEKRGTGRHRRKHRAERLVAIYGYDYAAMRRILAGYSTAPGKGEREMRKAFKLRRPR